MKNSAPPELAILPEDNPYRDLALGFRSHPGLESDILSIRRNCKGWLKVFELLQKKILREMRRKKSLYVLLLIDFDKYREERVAKLNGLPEDLRGRIFLMGCSKDSEKFKRTLGGGMAENIGYNMAEHCFGAPKPGAVNPWESPDWKENLKTVEKIRRIFGERLVRR